MNMPRFLPILWTLLLLFACKSTQKGTSPLIGDVDSSQLFLYEPEWVPTSLGFDELVLQWKLPPSLGEQSSFQVLVASDPSKLEAGVGDVWDSGIRYSAQQNSLPYEGKPLTPGTKIWWTVKAWDASGTSFPAGTQLLQVPETVESGYTIALLGGTLLSRMDKYGWLETALTAYWPQQALSFRNLGWPADDVFGTARSEFGSALNTQSWKPPDPEEGYGFEVLQEHMDLVQPQALIMGFGAEAAFAETEEAWEQFAKGYQQLLTAVEQRVDHIVLLSPTRFWENEDRMPNPTLHNQRLKRATEMIQELASQRGHTFIDLFETVVPQPKLPISDNGIHLNSQGYQMLASVFLEALGEQKANAYSVRLDAEGSVLESTGAAVGEFVQTSRGFRFDLRADRLSEGASLNIPGDHLVKIDGQILRERADTDALELRPDALQLEELREMIIEKNRLHRLRINPLNKVYTHLFRQHEMGHLAYETDDYARLVEEKEELIARLKVPQTHRYEVEFLAPWKSPREYPDHEVPEFIPPPDVQAELAGFTIAEGLELNLFASDPMIANPISITWDNRGRAWVATSTTYPQIKPGLEPIDRIVILEDSDQDGFADKSTVFAEGLLIPHSVMPVKGGAYVFTTTEFLFLADHDGDDQADETRVIYSGFGHGDVHHTIHCARWAPWGDLYFSQSININSFVETPYGFRKMNGSGFWEFHPPSERLEIFARGMINPWGQAFDEWGQCFATDGAGSQQPTYLFPGSAHLTAVGMDRILPGMISGKPKNTAAEIVSSSHLPEDWQGSLIASDFRANRTLRYALKENGSGYEAEETETILHSTYRSYRPVDSKIGPDGALYVVDWYSPIIDHGEVDFYHPSRDKAHGRIWRLTAKGRPLNPVLPIAEKTEVELLELLKSSEQFVRLQANRELILRQTSPALIKNWTKGLDESEASYTHHLLEALWLGVALGTPDEKILSLLLKAEDHHARAAAVRMVPRCVRGLEGEKLLAPLVQDAHPQVCMEAVNALRILQSPNAAQLALQAVDQEMDASLDYTLWLTAREMEDQWLPSLTAGETVFDGNFERLAFALNAVNNTQATASLAALVKEGKLSEQQEKNALLTIANLGGSEELGLALGKAAQRSDAELLKALAEAPSTNTAKPSQTEVLKSLLLHDQEEIRTTALQLFGRWQVPLEGELLVKQMEKSGIKTKERLAAADALVSLKELDLLEELATTHQSNSVRSASISAWAKHDPAAAMGSASRFLTQTSSSTQASLIFGTYISMREGPAMLQQNLQNKQLKEEVALAGIRLAQGSGRDLSDLVEVLKKAGSLKPVGMTLDNAQRKQLMASIGTNGNAKRGREVYLRPALVCATCHEINGDGGKVGPDLSTVGTYMTPESILESLINPSTAIKQGYETVLISKKNGQVVSGTLVRKTEQAALVRDAVGNVVSIPNSEIDNLEVSQVSMMPPGLTASLRQDELVDLLKYLTSLGK